MCSFNRMKLWTAIQSCFELWNLQCLSFFSGLNGSFKKGRYKDIVWNFNLLVPMSVFAIIMGRFLGSNGFSKHPNLLKIFPQPSVYQRSVIVRHSMLKKILIKYQSPLMRFSLEKKHYLYDQKRILGKS